MISLYVPAAWVTQGALPGVCARHGTPTMQWTRRRFLSRTPVWVFVLMIFSLLIGVLVAVAIRKTVIGQLPSCEVCTADRRRYLARIWTVWAADVALLVAAVARTSDALGVLWVLVTLVALIYSLAADRNRVAGVVSADEMWVELKGISSGFAYVVQQGLRAAYAGTPVQSAPQVPAYGYAPAPVTLAAPGDYFGTGTTPRPW